MQAAWGLRRWAFDPLTDDFFDKQAFESRERWVAPDLPDEAPDTQELLTDAGYAYC